MRMVVSALLLCCVLDQSLALGAQSPSGTVAASADRDTNGPRRKSTLSEAIEREATRQALLPDGGAGSRTQQPGSQSRSWIGRHPALFGALVGAGAGAIMSVTMENELF